mmetsp:Transcript_29629/g.87871  ORF Transcript_29629/g.87871 Transcript_29629/m.87871 type:complete len:354 (+) Transcript_29629:761-1822(+)
MALSMASSMALLRSSCPAALRPRTAGPAGTRDAAGRRFGLWGGRGGFGPAGTTACCPCPPCLSSKKAATFSVPPPPETETLDRRPGDENSSPPPPPRDGDDNGDAERPPPPPPPPPPLSPRTPILPSTSGDSLRPRLPAKLGERLLDRVLRIPHPSIARALSSMDGASDAPSSPAAVPNVSGFPNTIPAPSSSSSSSSSSSCDSDMLPKLSPPKDPLAVRGIPASKAALLRSRRRLRGERLRPPSPPPPPPPPPNGAIAAAPLSFGLRTGGEHTVCASRLTPVVAPAVGGRSSSSVVSIVFRELIIDRAPGERGAGASAGEESNMDLAGDEGDDVGDVLGKNEGARGRPPSSP